MNLVAADVSPLISRWGNLSRLTSAATSPKPVMVPMCAQRREEAALDLRGQDTGRPTDLSALKRDQRHIYEASAGSGHTRNT